MIEGFELRLVKMPLVRPFRTSFGTETDKECILVRASCDGVEGWGECVASPEPDYSAEFNEGAWLVMRDHLMPALLRDQPAAADAAATMSFVRGHPMAKAAIEMALLDARCRADGVSLSSFLGGTRERVEVGVSIGIQASAEEMVGAASGFLDEGYRRIKLKIEPGSDVEVVAAVRGAFPDILLSVDANGAYDASDMEAFEALERFGLLMIEQPMPPPDMWEHARLQERLRTDLCLDESITSAADASAALSMGACRIINIKQGRVGGPLEARRIHDLASAQGAPVWCGGMLETGIGRAANLALASLPGFTLPGDISASARYFHEDVTEPFVVAPDGTMGVPTGPGLGVDPDPDRLASITVRTDAIRKE
jgi:o-succinylbenzoate synthase